MFLNLVLLAAYCFNIDHGSSSFVLLLSVFQRLKLDPNNIRAFQSSQVGLSSKHVQVKDCSMLKTIFTSEVSTKMI